MPQIIIKDRTAHLGRYTFLQEMLINIKTCHFQPPLKHATFNHLFQTALSTTKNSFFTEHSSLATFVLWILQSF